MTVHINDNSAWRAFEESELTHSAAHYLMTIMHLRKQNGYARVTDVAEELKVTRSASSRAISVLKDRGWIDEDHNRMLFLTEDGISLARNVERNFIVMQAFLENVLKIPETIAREDSCKMEHLLSPETTAALFKLVQVLSKNEPLMKQLEKAMIDGTGECDHKDLCDICEEYEGCIGEEAQQ